MADEKPPAPITAGDSDEGEEEDDEEVQKVTEDAAAGAVAANNVQVVIGGSKSPREKAAEEEAIKAKVTKIEARNAISEFESHRRGYFGPEIHSNVTHWHAFAATLTKSNLENERVLEFFNKRLQVDLKYAEALLELPTSELKGGGGWKKVDKKGASTSTSTSGSGATNGKPAKASVPAMDELVTSTEGVGQKLSQFVASTRAAIVDDKLKKLVVEFMEVSSEILLQGQVSLENIAKSEKAVQGAFADYSKAAEHLAPVSPDEASNGRTGAMLSSSSDLWLADMNYRVAVQLQHNIWRESQEKLYALFGRMKQLELGRRQTLHTLVLRFVQSQGELWAQLPQVATGTALRISELKMDPHEVEAEIGDEIRSGAKAEQEKERTLARKASSGSIVGYSSPIRRRSSEAPPAPMPAHPGSPPPPSNEPFTRELKSPLEISLVKRVEVLEHRLTTGLESMPLLKRWRPALVVITLDNFLHVFDLPAEVTSSELSVAEAFRMLVPNPIDGKSGKFKRGKDAERVHPSVSVLMDSSRAKHKAEEGAEAFEVVEKINNSGFVKVFKAQEVTKVTLRARSQDKMVDWCVAINGPGATSPR